MPKYIEVEALGVDRCNPDVVADRAYAAGWNGLINIINSAPAADVAPVVYGRWKYIGENSTGKIMGCTNCARLINPEKKAVELKRQTNSPDYCPNCGALMDGKDEDNG